MTAEIAIMNKTAIALAADSAGTSGTKVYNSENKLFMLSKHYPVGIMIYDLLGFMGLPWEYIIKKYRDKLDKTYFPTLKGYSDNFIEHLQHIIPLKLQKEFFGVFVRNYFEDIKVTINQYLKNMVATDQNLKQILEYNCDGISEEDVLKSLDVSKKIQISVFLDSHMSILKSEVDYKWQNLPDGFIEDIKNDVEYQEIIKTNIENVFSDLPIMDDLKEQLKEIAILSFYLHHMTGIIIAGFGEEEKFPSVISTSIGPQVNGKLEMKPNEKETCQIEHFKGARIIPFAQHEMVDAFLDGVTPKYHAEAEKCLNDLIKSNSNNILQIIDQTKSEIGSGVSEDFINSLKEKITGAQDESDLNKFNQRMENVKKEHKNPILGAVNVLPKDELALMAESLVDITSLKRKASINELETVGGAIDVAVISKGDGFIWIKRKHYFNPDINHHFIRSWFDSDIKVKTNNEKK